MHREQFISILPYTVILSYYCGLVWKRGKQSSCSRWSHFAHTFSDVVYSAINQYTRGRLSENNSRSRFHPLFFWEGGRFVTKRYITTSYSKSLYRQMQHAGATFSPARRPWVWEPQCTASRTWCCNSAVNRYTNKDFLKVFTARCYAERGYATVSRLSVCLSVCLDCLWRWGMFFTQAGILRK